MLRHVVDGPVPEAAPGRRVGVVHLQGQRLGSGRDVAPDERGRRVRTGAAEAVEDELDRNDVARQVGARQRERRCLRLRLVDAASDERERGDSQDGGQRGRRELHGVSPDPGLIRRRAEAANGASEGTDRCRPLPKYPRASAARQSNALRPIFRAPGGAGCMSQRAASNCAAQRSSSASPRHDRQRARS